jgi:hypothetical protein
MMISETYRALNAQMHRDKPLYGTSGSVHAETVADLARRYDIGSILDYGCGKGTLKHALPEDLAPLVREYDPAIPGKDGWPAAADLVVCGDVMEHVEPDCLQAVIGHLYGLTRTLFYAEIATCPAVKTLPDGRNAHLIVEPMEWWMKKLQPPFRAAVTNAREKSFGIVMVTQ